MSDPENFIARWSRRKRQGKHQGALAKREELPEQGERVPPDAAAKSSPQDPHDRGASRQASAAADITAGKVPFDVASLPSLESITAESDIRAFLAPGVPAELTRAALRRAWSVDPKIRDFVGLAENSWDFNAPGAISGFGTLEMTDELRREVARMVGRSLGTEGPDRPAHIPSAEPDGQASVETTGESNAATETAPMVQAQSNGGTSQDEPMDDKNELYNSDMYLQRSQENIATQYPAEKPDNVQLIVKRPHGRALPK
jgi:Protein of unknown function (DUF3306)